MKMTRTQQWISTIFLGTVIVTIGGLLYRIVAGQVDPYYAEWAKNTATVRASLTLSSVTDQRVVLMKGEAVTIDRTRLVYRGLEDDSACVDLYLLDLDREYAYPRRIPRSAEGELVNLGGRSYRLVSTHRRQVVMTRIN
ncbi:MAG: hypothetical protein ABIL58_26870 [Pseudomonadota bacterium]